MISMDDIQGAFDKGIAKFSKAKEAVKFIAKSKNTPEKEQSRVQETFDDFTL